MVFRLHVINAEEGDCLLLEYGEKTARFILLDGGPAGVWETDLKPTLRRLGNPRLEAMVLTHIDTDHTTGLRDMLAELQVEQDVQGAPSIAIGGLWMNAFGDVIDEDGKLRNDLESLMGMAGAANVSLASAGFALLGVKDGNDVRLRAAQLSIARNPQWGGKPILVGAAPPFAMDNLTLRTHRKIT